MTMLQFINMFFFQLFFVRLTKHGEIINGKFNITHWSFMYWVIPFTGWNSEFKYIGKQAKFLYL